MGALKNKYRHLNIKQWT